MFDTLLRKDYTPLLASKNWAKVRDNLIMSSPIAAKDPIMAKNLAIKRCWFHSGKYPHYDIPKGRIGEIQAKCSIISSKEILKIIKNGTL